MVFFTSIIISRQYTIKRDGEINLVSAIERVNEWDNQIWEMSEIENLRLAAAMCNKMKFDYNRYSGDDMFVFLIRCFRGLPFAFTSIVRRIIILLAIPPQYKYLKFRIIIWNKIDLMDL